MKHFQISNSNIVYCKETDAIVEMTTSEDGTTIIRDLEQLMDLQKENNEYIIGVT